MAQSTPPNVWNAAPPLAAARIPLVTAGEPPNTITAPAPGE